MTAKRPAPPAARRGPSAPWLIGAVVVLVLLIAWWLALRAVRSTTAVPITPIPAGEAAGKYQEPDAMPLNGSHRP